MKVILDTNILISALLKPASAPGELIVRWRAGDFMVVTSEKLLDELERVLNYRKFARSGIASSKATRQLKEDLREVSLRFESSQEIRVVGRDPSDDKFIALGVAMEVDFIISGDNHLLEIGSHAGIRILTPSEFLLLLDAQKQ